MKRPENYKEILQYLKSRVDEGKMSRERSDKILLALRVKMIKDDSVCERCGAKDNLTLDHIVPFQLLVDFGLDVEVFTFENNFQVLCRRCNTFKANRLDFADKRTKPLLLKFVEMIKN